MGVGGGLISPMRRRWETILNKAEQEAPRAAAEARANSGQATANLKAKARSAQPDRPAPAERVTTVIRDGGSYAGGAGSTNY